MNRCPITYEEIKKEERYSEKGLRLLSKKLEKLEDLAYSAEEQREQAALRITKMSIQGVQPKLSAKLSVKKSSFTIVDSGGTYILKPPHAQFQNVPENEALTMQLANTFEINVPTSGLCYAKDGTFTYFIKRFDRYGRGKKRIQEDFSQLLGKSRDTKYASSIEQVISVIDEHCTFPQIEKIELLKRILFSFLTGNEDMHLKNYSLIVDEGKVTLSPAYDLLNTTLILQGAEEESALPLKGKKKNLTKNDFFAYLASERMELNASIIEEIKNTAKNALSGFSQRVSISFLPAEQQEMYINIVEERAKRLEL